MPRRLFGAIVVALGPLAIGQSADSGQRLQRRRARNVGISQLARVAAPKPMTIKT